MMCVALACVPHMLRSNEKQICVKSASKFLGLIAEDSTYLSWVMMCDEILGHSLL